MARKYWLRSWRKILWAAITSRTMKLTSLRVPFSRAFFITAFKSMLPRFPTGSAKKGISSHVIVRSTCVNCKNVIFELYLPDFDVIFTSIKKCFGLRRFSFCYFHIDKNSCLARFVKYSAALDTFLVMILFSISLTNRATSQVAVTFWTRRESFELLVPLLKSWMNTWKKSASSSCGLTTTF